MTAAQIVDLLAIKHGDDVFVPECKTGSTPCIRIDVWAMAKSWADPRTFGYEIKVSRSDFVNDTKWRAYLPYCSEFYFICPSGLIAVEELPEDVGLVWVSKTGGKLLTKRKAPARTVAIPEDLFRYVLMWRAKVNRSDYYETRSKADQMREWLQKKQHGRKLDYAVKGRIAELWDQVNEENKKLLHRMETYDDVRKRLSALGYDPDAPIWVPNVESKARKLIGHDTDWAQAELGRVIERLQTAQRTIREIGQ